MILRGLTELLIGVAYGLIVGAGAFLLTRIGLDHAHPGPLIPNAVEMAWFFTVMAALITGVCGTLVGLVVALSGVNRAKAAGIGFSMGLLALALLALDSCSVRELVKTSWRDMLDLLVALIMLPIGLALMSVLVAVVAPRLKPYDL